MECLKFQQMINDFIYDKIEYSEDLEEFLEHAKECKSCDKDLVLYYTIHRGLGDIPSPDNVEESTDYERELNDIISFYDDYFTKQKIMHKAGKLSIVVFFIVVICTIIYLFLRASGNI